MVQQQNEFTTEFESTRAIMLKQLFASGLVKINNYSTIFTKTEVSNCLITVSSIA